MLNWKNLYRRVYNRTDYEILKDAHYGLMIGCTIGFYIGMCTKCSVLTSVVGACQIIIQNSVMIGWLGGFCGFTYPYLIVLSPILIIGLLK